MAWKYVDWRTLSDLTFLPTAIFADYQKEKLSECEYWLVQEVQSGLESGGKVPTLVQSLLNTQIAFQIILPRQSELVFVCGSRSWVYRALVPPRWPDMLSDHTTDEETKTIVKGTQMAFATNSVRLTNPFYFLKLGLQADNPGVRSFLWTTGIDSLLVANSEAKFKRHLSNLLGANSYVFPADEQGRQPIYKVDALACRMYKLRSLIAHGLEIDASFRKQVGFRTTGGVLATEHFPMYLEADVLNEGALFLLCTILRRIVSSQPMFELFLVQDNWTKALDLGTFPS